MNELLRFQLKDVGYEGGDLTQLQMKKLLNVVNDSYNKADENRKNLEDMLKVSSKGMQTLYKTLKDNSKDKLASSEEKYRRLISNLQPYYFFYTKSPEGRFLSVSESVKDMLGYTHEEFIERYGDIFMKKISTKSAKQQIRQKEGKPYELVIQHKNGTTYYLELTEFPIYDSHNKVKVIEGILRNITEQVRTRKRISDMLHYDALTGISNRLHLEVLMDNLLLKKDARFALLFLDLDYFKHINDTLGHDIGDTLLQHVAENIAQILGEDDIFARVGGDEFIIVLNDLDTLHLTLMIDKIMKLIRQPWMVRNYELRISASIGISLYPDDGETTIELMKNADIAMYQSKSLGRDNFTFFKEEFNTSVHTEMKLIQDMSSALDNNEFIFYFQPKALLETNEIVSAEALIRWEHPELGFIMPDKFIDLAENTGYILKLGRWIIEEACRAIVRFNKIAPDKKLKLSINISVRQFQHTDMFDILEQELKKNRLDGSQLLIELTESIMMENNDEMAETLKKIKSLNVGILLDDFGTGYSTLSYLDKLSIDALKIDKAFVDAIPKDGTKNILLDTIISMGKMLNMKVIAEGVEHEYQYQYLCSAKCDLYQGYYLSKPLCEKDYIKYIESY